MVASENTRLTECPLEKSKGSRGNNCDENCSMISESQLQGVPVCRKATMGSKARHRSQSSVHFCHCLLALMVFLSLGLTKAAQIYSNDINAVEEEPIKVNWGLSDTSATVGKVFSFHIPQDTFQGDVSAYKVFESGKDTLPSWIAFDDNLRTLQGVPNASDKGQYTLEVHALGRDKTPKAKDFFSITVKEDSAHISSSKPLKSMGKTAANPVNCRSGDHITMVTIVVDTDLDQLPPAEKFALANKLTSHLNIAAEMLKMAPVGNKAKFDSSALVAGPGDAKSSQFPGAFVSWLVGCGKVESDHMPVLQQVETSSANGEMSNAIGHGIVGWHVTSSRLKPTVKRVRRQVYATATQGLTMPPPTKAPAVTVTSTDTGMPIDPGMTRAVPSMVSPTFSEIQPTKTYTEPVRPTDSAEYIRPSKTVEMEPTKTVTDTSPVTPKKPDMTRSQVLEPSVSAPDYETTKHTDMLPPTTTEMTKAPTLPGETPTEPSRLPPTMTSTRAPETTPSTRRTGRPVVPVDQPYACPKDGIDRHPEVWEKVEPLSVKVGEHMRFKIPEKAFFDCDDGNTRKLVTDIYTADKLLLEDSINWLRYDKKKQVIVGLPLNSDGGQVYNLLIIASDSKGAVARQTLDITVEASSEEAAAKVNHEFAFTIDYDYDKFMSDPKNRIDLSNKVARLYGDKNPKRMTVTKIARGSVVYAWTNNTLPTDDCPVESVVELMSKFLTKNLTLTEEAKRAMEPYKISKAAAVPSGSCEDVDFNEALQSADIEPEPTPEYNTVPPAPEPGDDDDDDDEPGDDADKSTEEEEDDDDDIWITTVVPAVVIVAILIIALIIACILYRKKRKGKMDMQDHHTFVNKGVPVIFADELEDRPSESSKPLILEEEKPPNPPPEYRRSSSASAGSTPPTNHKDTAAVHDEEQEMDENDVTSPLYRPPPPVTASSENKQPRPHVQPAYRNPPPYVPP